MLLWLTSSPSSVRTVWKTARPKLIQCLDPIRARNLQLQAEGRREARRRSLRPYYDELRGSLDHSSITYLAFPSFDEWCKFTLVRDVWTPGDGKVVEQVKIDEAKDAILAHCLGLNPALKASIAQHLGGLPARTPSIYSYTSSASELASLYTYHSDANLTDLEWVILNLPVDFERCSSTSCGIKRLLAVVLEELATNPSAIRPNLITEARFTSAVRELQIVKSILNKLGWNGVSDPVQCMENRGQGFRCSGCDQRGARGGLSHWEWHPFVSTALSSSFSNISNELSASLSNRSDTCTRSTAVPAPIPLPSSTPRLPTSQRGAFTTTVAVTGTADTDLPTKTTTTTAGDASTGEEGVTEEGWARRKDWTRVPSERLVLFKLCTVKSGFLSARFPFASLRGVRGASSLCARARCDATKKPESTC